MTMNRQQEPLKRKPTVAGSRSLRAHKRDVERKIKRDETLSRHRNLSAMSPLKENAGNVKAGRKTSQKVKGPQDATENRKQMLQKWKAERELKKKLQQREQGKKPVFRVTHIVPETVAYSKPLPQRKHVDAPTKDIKVPDRRVTRASIAAAKPPARCTRSSNITEKVSGPSVTRKRPSARATKFKTAPEAAPASQTVRGTGPASVPAVTATSKLPPARVARRTSNKRTDTRHVTQARGESSTSFAPDNFKFAPPTNLSQVVFNPLSPVSAQCFMFTAFDTTTDSRRCSTPKVVLKRMSAVHSPSVSVIRPVKQSSTKTNSMLKTSTSPEPASEKGIHDTADVEPASATGTPNDAVPESTIEKAATGEKKNVTFSPVSSGNVTQPDLSTTAPVMSLKDVISDNEENMPPPVSTAVVRTPGRAPRQRRHTAAELPASSGRSSKKTPRCNSLILQHLSPEDRVDVLLHSPMVEVRRRPPKVHHTPGINIELPNFDDVDLSIVADPLADISTTGDTGRFTADLVTQEKPAGNTSDTAVTGSDTVTTGSDTAVTASDTSAIGSDTAALTGSDTAAVTASDTAAVTASDTAAATGSDTDAAASVTAAIGSDTAATGSDTAAATGSDTAATGSNTADPVSKVKSYDDLSQEHDVSYFRELLVSETKRLTAESDKWNEIISLTDNLLEEVEGQIRTTVGQAQLLMRQRFKQFSGLVDNCEFGTGEKTTLCTDLQGFWEMIYFQVEDVDNKFVELSKLRANNWVKEVKQQPKRKKTAKKPVAKKPVAAARSKFGAFLAKMKQQKTTTVAGEEKDSGTVEKEGKGASAKEEDGVTKEDDTARKEDNAKATMEEEVGMTEGGPVGSETNTKMKTFDGGFFSVDSPVHSPLLRQKCGSSAKKSLSQPGSKNGSRANTPGGSCNSKSLLLVSVMKCLSQSAQRRSSSPRLSGGGDSSHTTHRSVATTPSGGSTGQLRRSRRSLAVCIESDTPNVFSPRNTDTLDRCVEGVGGETHTVPHSCMESMLSKYLVPTKLQEEESMDVDQLPSVGDVDMSSQMKRNLSAEFDRQSLSREQRSSRSALVTPKHLKSAVKRRCSAVQVSGQRSTRRSVRFIDASDSLACERLPVTPFNKSSRVPRKRSNSSTSHSDSTASSAFPATPTEQSDSDTPVRKLARLTVKHTPAGRAATPMTKMPDLAEADEGETSKRPPVIRDDLMSFSPVFMTPPMKKLSNAMRTPNRTPRRSTRLSLL